MTKKTSSLISEWFYLGSPVDQVTVRLLVAYMVVTCGEFPL
mgnify:CR=1 FL=1|jgi:hypothetical protein